MDTMKISIIYYSKTGHTKEMGEEIAAGIRSEGGEARLFSVEEPLDAEYIASSDGVNSHISGKHLLADEKMV